MARNRSSTGERAKQMALIRTWQKERFVFGGSLNGSSHPKTKRVFRPKLAMHVVMKSGLARGKHSLLRYEREVARIVKEECLRRFVTLHHAANAGTHLHLLVQAPSASHFNAFLKVVSCRISMLVTGSRKGRPFQGKPHPNHALGFASSPEGAQGQARRFWDARPYVRLLSAKGPSFLNTLAYISMNSTETSARLSRQTVRRMFGEIRDAIRRGLLPRSPGLLAAGFV